MGESRRTGVTPIVARLLTSEPHLLYSRMAPDTVSIVKAAAKANDVNRLKAAMDAWMAEEDPDPPRDPRWPTSEIQAVLTLALDWGNIEVADELLKRGCYANYSGLSTR